MNRLYVMYERECMTTPKDKYFDNMLEALVYYNDHHNAPLSNENLRKAVSKFMAETEEEERKIILDADNVTMDTFSQYCSQYKIYGYSL